MQLHPSSKIFSGPLGMSGKNLVICADIFGRAFFSLLSARKSSSNP
jgi:hypothetical protein